MIANPYAEQAVVGAALVGNPLGVVTLADDDFTDHRLKLIAASIRDYVRHNPAAPIDPVVIAGQLGRAGQLGTRGIGSTDYLHGLTDSAIGALSLSYARDVRAATIVRRTKAAADRLAGLMGSDDALGQHAEALAEHREALASLPESLDGAVSGKLATIADLFAEEFTYDWLVPDLIERGERIVMVAGEGAGKSVFATQAAVCVAAGLHPWTGQPCGEPARVLLIDAENGRRQTQRRYKWIGDKATRATPGWANQIFHEIHPEGLDLAGKDRAWFYRVCAEASPDLIILGPAYKLTQGNPQLDSDMLALFSVLDEIRIKHNAALLIEAHTGHAADKDGKRIVRPYGSSVWLRWPEVGLGLSRGPNDQGDIHPTHLTVGHWRGTREERQWPAEIERGTGRNALPWVPLSSEFMSTTARRANAR